MLEDVGNPLGISLVGFLSPNGFHIFGVSEDDIAGAVSYTHLYALSIPYRSRTCNEAV